MATKRKTDPALIDIAVRAELFYLNLQDELSGRSDLSQEEIETAFGRAMQNTQRDLRKADPAAPAPNPLTRSAKRDEHRGERGLGRWTRPLRATLAAFAVAGVVRLVAYLLLGQ